MRKQSSTVWLALWLVSVTCLAAQEVAEEIAHLEIPEHPAELEFGNLDFQVPDGDRFRHLLSNGVVVYVVEDHQLPIVDLTATLRIGSFLDPTTKPGLAATTGVMLRQGGAGSLSAEQFDERVDFLAAEIDSDTGATFGSASLNCITPVLDESLGLFFDMLRTPRFQEDRLALEKDQAIESMKQRNDQPQSISRRNWQWLMRGMDSFLARQLTEEQVRALTPQDLTDFHSRYWQPKNMIIGVSGDVDTERILAMLEERFAGWESSGTGLSWPPSPPTQVPEPGVYRIQKDIPQGRVLIGHLGYQRADWTDPEVQPLVIMNEILGGGGFTSRLVKRIRSDEGLAYSVFSRFGIDPWWPGLFTMGYQSKSSTVALAANIAVEEIERIRRERISDEELDTAKASFIEVFPRQFESAARTVGVFVRDEYEGRPHDYWLDYRDQVAAVSKKEVQQAARRFLHPDQLVYLIVGNWQEIEPGDAEGRASMREIMPGEPVELPLRDPLTLEPLSN